jgi:hypothetical protein
MYWRKGIYIRRTIDGHGVFSIFYATPNRPGDVDLHTVVPGMYGILGQLATMLALPDKLLDYSRMLYTFGGFVAVPMTAEERQFLSGVESEKTDA